MLFALVAVPFVVLVKHLGFAELIKAVIDGYFSLMFLLLHIPCISINSCCSFNAREMGLEAVFEVLLPS